MNLSKDRIGRFTASSIHRLIRGPSGGEKGRETYIFEKAVESITGQQKEFHNKYTDHGHMNEFEAIEEFSNISGLLVEHLNQEFFKINENLGATPDAKVIDFKGKILASVDVKCPSESFFEQKMLMIKESKPEYQNSPKAYFYQAQTQMLALGVDTHYLVRYLTNAEIDDDGNKVEYNLPIETRIYWKVIKADKDVQDEIIKEAEDAAKERDLLIEILKTPILQTNN